MMQHWSDNQVQPGQSALEIFSLFRLFSLCFARSIGHLRGRFSLKVLGARCLEAVLGGGCGEGVSGGYVRWGDGGGGGRNTKTF